jgi:hypothetical protein
MVRFRNHMIGENVQVFWAALQRGEFISDAAVAAGTYRKQGTRWVIVNGAVRPRRGRNLKGRCLRFTGDRSHVVGRRTRRDELHLRRLDPVVHVDFEVSLGRSCFVSSPFTVGVVPPTV